MIELGVEPKRKSIVIAEDEPAHYLILGDFGGRATEPLAVDRDNFDAVMQKLQVSLAGTAFGELDDFHPDRLYRNLNLFREFDVAPRAEPAKTDAPKADIGELLRPSGLLEQIAEGGDPMERYLRELARADAAAPEAADPQREAALGQRMRGLLHHPRFQAVEASWRGLDFVIRGAEGAAWVAGMQPKGKGFDFDDLREQLQQMISMGGIQGFLDKLPGAAQLAPAVKQGVDERLLRRQIALIDSMTRRERRFPDLINASRKRRIAAGSGMQVQDVNRLLKQFTQMQKMMKKMAGGGLQRMMRGMRGRLPPGALH